MRTKLVVGITSFVALLGMQLLVCASPVHAQGSFRADCICRDSNGYINAQFFNKPNLGGLKVGNVVTVSAGVCYHLSACGNSPALAGTVKMQVNGWTENTYMVYKFDLHGPQR